MNRLVKGLKKDIDDIHEQSPKIIKRIINYGLISIFAVFIDYTIFFFLLNTFNLYYLVAVFISFIIAHSINYYLNWKNSFKETKCPIHRTYTLFILFGISGVVMTLSFLGVLVSALHIKLITARIIVSVIVGILGFIFHYFFTFDMICHLKKDFKFNKIKKKTKLS